MIIDEIEIRHIRLELLDPFETSFGREYEMNPLIVKIRCGDTVAYGETPTMVSPTFSPEFTQGAILVLRDYIAPAILGREITSPEDLHQKIGFIKGNYFAKAGIDTAVHVLIAQERGQSLSKLLGGTQEKIVCGSSTGIQRDESGNISIDKLLEEVDRCIKESYRRIKIKIKPGYDLEPVKAIRDAFGYELMFQVDANSAYTLDHIDIFKKMDRYRLALIEQPLAHDDIIDHSKLQKAIETPICLDESVQSLDDARHAIELGSARIINIKLARVGGLYHAKAIHDYCQERGVPVWCGGMFESAVGLCHAIAIASLPNFTQPADLGPGECFFVEDMIKSLVKLEDGCIKVPEDAGLGAEVDTDFLERATVEKVVVGG